jgi:phosphinothricin acetyltransferase
MQIIECEPARHAAPVLEILNDVIATSTALFDYQPRTLQSMQGWFAAKHAGRFPVIGAERDGRLLGFASYGSFRAWPAYKYSVENSVYVAAEARGQGVGLLLMRQLIARAFEQQYHTVVAGIVADNAPSIALHERLGFSHCGTIREAGFKFGKWLDLAFYQLRLSTPANPVDG